MFVNEIVNTVDTESFKEFMENFDGLEYQKSFVPHKDFDQLVESFNAFDYKHFDKVFVETRRLDIFVIAQKKARCKFPIMNSTLISRK